MPAHQKLGCTLSNTVAQIPAIGKTAQQIALNMYRIVFIIFSNVYFRILQRYIFS